jgi:hypothetical protein
MLMLINIVRLLRSTSYGIRYKSDGNNTKNDEISRPNKDTDTKTSPVTTTQSVADQEIATETSAATEVADPIGANAENALSGANSSNTPTSSNDDDKNPNLDLDSKLDASKSKGKSS